MAKHHQRSTDMTIKPMNGDSQSPASAELTCDHCGSVVAMTYDLATGKACAPCARALMVAKIMDELYTRYEAELEGASGNTLPYPAS